jgi:hypothetical protein
MPRQYKPSVVYALVDPRDLAVRYIGVTHSPRTRQLQHVTPNTTPTSGPKVREWIASLAAEGLAPSMVKLEEVDGKRRMEKESQWIYFGRSVGWDLLNTTGGTVFND